MKVIKVKLGNADITVFRTRGSTDLLKSNFKFNFKMKSNIVFSCEIIYPGKQRKRHLKKNCTWK